MLGRESVINLPESLYLLELLLREKFELLNDKNIQEQLKLFDISCVDSFSLGTLDKLNGYGMINDESMKEIDRKIEQSEKILKLIKY